MDKKETKRWQLRAQNNKICAVLEKIDEAIKVFDVLHDSEESSKLSGDLENIKYRLEQIISRNNTEITKLDNEITKRRN